MKCDDEHSYFDCNNCAFNEFMSLLGVRINSKTCWINCTNKNHDQLELLFDMILNNTVVDENRNIIYTANDNNFKGEVLLS